MGVDLEEREGGWGRSLLLLEAVDDGKLIMLVICKREVRTAYEHII